MHRVGIKGRVGVRTVPSYSSEQIPVPVREWRYEGQECLDLTFEFPRNVPVQYEGRNGYAKCVGIGIGAYRGARPRVAIVPINSKKHFGSCRIEMDPATIDALIECLNRCKAFMRNSQAYATNVTRMEDDGHR